MTQLKVLIGLLIGIQILDVFVNGLQENQRFCIRTDPLLLADIEKHVNPIADDPFCETLATTLTMSEKETLHKTMCKDYGSTRKDEYHFLQIYNGHLKGRANHTHICSGKQNPLLAWIPYKMMQQRYAVELNPKEHFNYVAKATDVEREKNELCHFRHTDLATNISENLFTCIVMVFEDNFYGLDAEINVLVEIMPLMYELRNVSYLPWMNVSTSYKTQLGKTALKNQSPEHKEIYGSISYAYVEKINLNTSTVYRKKLKKLPILFQHRGEVLELDHEGNGGVSVKEKSYFGRLMDAKSSVNVELIGQWVEQSQQFTADIYEYFGYGIRRFRQEMNGGQASFMRIQNSEPIYEMPESTHVAKATVHKSPIGKNHKFQRLTDASSELSENENSTEDNFDWETEELDNPSTDGHPYPGLYPWSIIGGLIVGAVLLAAVIGMVRTCSREKKEAHKYKVAASS